MTKNCLQCGNEFTKTNDCSNFNWNNRKKFCSKKCQYLHKSQNTEWCRRGMENNRWSGGPMSLNCKICSRQFEVARARIKAKTCSIECRNAYKRLPENREAMRKTQRDRVEAGLHNLYRGVTALYTLIRKSAQYKQWRTAIYKRDGYRCQNCGRIEELQADHIKQFAYILMENDVKSVEDAIACTPLWDLNNGRTLCVPCHKETGTWGIKNFAAITRQSQEKS